MKFEKFEKAGLKIDKERALTYSQLNCPLDCKYCFVEDMNFNQKRNVAYLSENQIELIKQLPEEVTLLMLGCDTEFFQRKQNSLETLEELVDLGKDISVVTKLSLPDNFIEKLSEIDKKLNNHGNFLAFSMSIPCLDSAKDWEPRVPKPNKRIRTLQTAFKKNLKTLVALRPLLPTISDDELEKIVSSTKDYCYGYYSGPLYLKDLNLPLLNKIDTSDFKIEKIQPPWMPKGNIFYKIEKVGQMETLEKILQKHNKSLFEGAAEAVKYLKEL